MADRDNGPHYIPELDPEHPKRPKTIVQPLLLTCVVGGLVCLTAAGIAWFFGLERLAVVLVIIAMLFLIPFYIGL